MAATSGLAEPPDDLDGVPSADHVQQLHRLSEWPGTWWFSSVRALEDDQGGRFDLANPLGTCYLAEDSLDGALIEKLLRTPAKVVVSQRLDELFHAVVTVRKPPATADLASPAATGFGLTAEIHTVLDYRLARRWARALQRVGWRAIRHRLRGDVGGTLAGRALFGAAGLPARAPAGMTTSVAPLDVATAEQLLHARNVEVRPIPIDVPISPPPPTPGLRS